MNARANVHRLGQPNAFVAAASAAAWKHATQTLPLSGALPENLELTTWQLLEDGSAILRLTHIYPTGEHPALSKPATVDLCAVFGSKLCARLAKLAGVGGEVIFMPPCFFLYR